MLSGLSRKGFSDVARLSVATLRSWEEPGEGRRGITAKGATRFIKALSERGVFCSADWLLRGEGIGPRLLTPPLVARPEADSLWSEEESILRDIQAFKDNNDNPVLLMVIDTAMAPLFTKGEYVGGSKRIGSEIQSMIHCDCIVETPSGLLLRRLGQHLGGDIYLLIALNQDAQYVSAPTTILSAAEVVWRRSRRGAKRTSSEDS